MRTQRTVVALFGALLLVAGILLLLQAMGAAVAVGLFWGVLFLAAAAVFWYLFATGRETWWAALPGGALLGLGLTVLAGEAGLPGAAMWGGSLFLGSMGAGFAAVYLRQHERWWAIIPAGVLITLAVTSVWDAAVSRERASGALFFAGLALTFALVAVLPGGPGRQRWAWIPAAALAVLAVLIALEAAALLSVLDYLWPLALIAGGGVLLWRALGRWHTTEPLEASGERTTSTDVAPDSHGRDPRRK
ncbi:hypothetical protein AVL61_00785 [Kocuria rosea subsp. polaris]|uniref:Uncharacterized protein n=1 Tax=Kocuria rosea subsp. polaris TaxID=136273 RepID=A0A0W8INT7_KOCRO|nr:hypothetical protein [Kocuria polaris]KUG61496.1 hypothetical protein AVL61_00785 [Kocuria polaris]